MAQEIKNPTSTREDMGLIPDLFQWVKDPALPMAMAAQAGSHSSKLDP